LGSRLTAKKRIITRASACLIIALAAVVLFSFRTSYLVLSNDNSGAILLRHRVDEGEEFSVSFIHSVNISPVTDIFQIRDGQIVLIALEFETFGAGMPTELEPGQALVHLPEGGMRIEGFDRPFAGLRYIIGYTTEHTVQIGSRQIPLKTLDAPGQPVLFEFTYLTIWQRLSGN